MTPAAQRLRFLLVTTCYQGFTLSDGALRMLVLLHLQQVGRTPWALALVLLPYEVAGVFTNLLGGWLGARFGLRLPLLLGLWLQALACVLLAADPAWLTLPYLMATQVLSGVAKDLTKTAAKSYVKRLAPAAADAGPLFGMVAWLTGSKNVTKGLGFFVGGALLALAGFRGTNAGLALLLALLALAGGSLLQPEPGKPNPRPTSVLAHGTPVRWLAAARLCLFGSRDAGFTIAVPLFLAGALAWPSPSVGAFLSAWVIGYGLLQAATPRFLRPEHAAAGARWTTGLTWLLLVPLLGTAAGLAAGAAPSVPLLAGLCVYGVVFAMTSSLHSWLVLAIADGDDVVERVGFYYAANSAGRLLGTLASGAVYGLAVDPVDGLQACLLVAGALVVVAALCSQAVRPPR